MFPPNDSMTRRPLPSTGFPRVSSPASRVLRGVPTPCGPSRRPSLSFGWQYHLPCACVRLPSGPTPTGGLEHLGLAAPCHVVSRMEPQGLPGSWTTLLHLCPGLRPRRDRHARPLPHVGTAPRLKHAKGSHDDNPFAAQCPGLSARCLRFVVWVTPPLHARLASGCWPALPDGIGYPQSCDERFQ
jgi:hypothetical protein